VSSLLTFVAANGTFFFSMYVLKATFVENNSAEVTFALKEAPKASRRSWRRLFYWASTCYHRCDFSIRDL